MAKLIVSMATYGELYSQLEKQGQSLNNGQVLTIEKGTAVMPPVDFRLVAVRQNCLEAASTAYIPEVVKDYNKQDDVRFIQFCESIFQWCLNGVDRTNPEPVAKPKSETKSNPNKGGW